MKWKRWWNNNGLLAITLIAVGVILIWIIFKPKLPILADAALGTVRRGHAHPKHRKVPKLKYESQCRAIVERLYGKKFPKKRPDFLKNPKTGRNLELDLYNDELKLAFEYNGEQHYHYSRRFHGTREKFEDQVYRDHFKRAACDEAGVSLIEIPYTVPYDQLEAYIVAKTNGVDLNGYEELANRTSTS